MRCVDVVRELAVPTGALDPSALDSHLASCATCAREAQHVSQFDHLWNATRPEEPDQQTIERMWNRISRKLEHPSVTAPATISFAPARAHRGWMFAAIAVAQAAAVLVAGVLVLQWANRLRTGTQGAEVAAAVPNAAPAYFFDIEPGQTLVLEVDAGGERVTCRSPVRNTAELAQLDDSDDAEPISVAVSDMLFLNGMESIGFLGLARD